MPKQTPGCKNQWNKNGKKKFMDIEESELEKLISTLAKNPNVQIDALSKNDPLYKTFERVKIASSMLYDTSQNKIIYNIISKYPVPQRLDPGTFGAFLFGCKGKDYGAVKEKNCSILCMNNIPLPKDKEKNICCTHQVWLHDNIVFKKLNDAKTESALIYVQIPFTGFSKSDVQKLKDNGVTKVTVLETINGKHIVLLDKQRPDTLPLKDFTPIQMNGTGGTGGVGSRVIVWNTGTIIIVILVIVIIIAIIWFVMNRGVRTTREGIQIGGGESSKTKTVTYRYV